MNQTKSRTIDWKLWIGVLISALFLYLAFRDVDLKLIWGHIRSARFFPLFLVFITVLVQHIIRAWRWKIILEPIKKTGFFNRLLTILIGFGGNSVLPARLGELIRAVYFGKKEDMSSSSALGTVVVERILDGFIIIIILLIGLVGCGYNQEWKEIAAALKTSGYIFLLSFALITIFFIGLKVKTKYFLNLLDGILFFLPRRPRKKIIEIVNNFSIGLVLMRTIHGWLGAILYSILIWLINLFQIQWIGQSLDINITFLSTTLLLMFAVIGVAIPSAPGFVGTFHLSTQYGFMLFGLGKEEALSAAILWHAAVVLPNILFGAVAFLLLQISMKKKE